MYTAALIPTWARNRTSHLRTKHSAKVYAMYPMYVTGALIRTKISLSSWHLTRAMTLTCRLHDKIKEIVKKSFTFAYFTDGVVTNEEAEEVVNKLNREKLEKQEDRDVIKAEKKNSANDSDSGNSGTESVFYCRNLNYYIKATYM